MTRHTAFAIFRTRKQASRSAAELRVLAVHLEIPARVAVSGFRLVTDLATGEPYRQAKRVVDRHGAALLPSIADDERFLAERGECAHCGGVGVSVVTGDLCRCGVGEMAVSA